jgi:hypothetical protein
MVQRRLRKMDIDFASMTVEEGVNNLLQLLQEQNGNDGRHDALLQKGTRLEVALLKEQNGMFTRSKVSSRLLDR